MAQIKDFGLSLISQLQWQQPVDDLIQQAEQITNEQQNDQQNDQQTKQTIKNTILPHQLLLQYLIHPMSTKYRFLIKHPTGSGKSLSGLLICQNFIQKNKIPIIVTFQQSQFIQELKSRPELGVVTSKQLQLYDTMDQESKYQLNRQWDKTINKKYIFFGYIELYNHLFLQDGLNMQFLQQLKGNLLICDEIHNIYNHFDKNIFGAIIYFLSYVFGEEIFMVFMSATPISYSQEINSLLQLMYVEYNKDVKKKILADIQKNYKNQVQDQIHYIQQHINQVKEQISKDQLEKQIILLLSDNVSYIQELESLMPKVIYKGEYYQSMSDLKIVKCQIKGQFLEYIKNNNYLKGEEWQKYIYLNLMNNTWKSFIELYVRGDQNIINHCNQNQITVKESIFSSKTNRLFNISGDWLLYNNIENHSPKLFYLLDKLLTTNKRSFVYINKIQQFGVDIVINMLSLNGFIHVNQSPHKFTICFKCKTRFDQHTEQGHHFIPYKYIYVTGLNQRQSNQELQHFNSISNITNPTVQIIIGSIKIKEGYNILGINNTFILALPYNIPNLIQVMGRTVRTGSHLMLDPSNRYVNIEFLVNSLQDSHLYQTSEYHNLFTNTTNSNYFGKISNEELDIWQKVIDFKQVQIYDQIINSQSINLKYQKSLFNIKTIDGQNMVISNNQLKNKDFQTNNIQYTSSNIYDGDLQTFYLLDTQTEIDSYLHQTIVGLLKYQSIWHQDDILQELKKGSSTYNLNLIPDEYIINKILFMQNIQVINSYFIYTTNTSVDLNFFFSEYAQPFVTIPVQQFKIQLRDLSIIKPLFSILIGNFKHYVTQFLKGDLQLRFSPLQTDSLIQSKVTQLRHDILKQCIKITLNIDQSWLIETYKQNIILYNKQENNEDQTIIMYLSVLNTIFPLVFDNGKITGFMQNYDKYHQISEFGVWVIRQIPFELIDELIVVVINRQYDISLLEKSNIIQQISKRQKQRGLLCQSFKKQQFQQLLQQYNIDIQQDKNDTIQNNCKYLFTALIEKHLVNIFTFQPIKGLFFNIK